MPIRKWTGDARQSLPLKALNGGKVFQFQRGGPTAIRRGGPTAIRGRVAQRGGTLDLSG